MGRPWQRTPFGAAAEGWTIRLRGGRGPGRPRHPAKCGAVGWRDFLGQQRAAAGAAEVKKAKAAGRRGGRGPSGPPAGRRRGCGGLRRCSRRARQPKLGRLRRTIGVTATRQGGWLVGRPRERGCPPAGRPRQTTSWWDKLGRGRVSWDDRPAMWPDHSRRPARQTRDNCQGGPSARKLYGRAIMMRYG